MPRNAPAQITTLYALFGEVIVCPGLIGAFGSRVDPKGRLRIPGALTGVREAKRCLKGWEKRAQESEKVTWWLERLGERGRSPLKASSTQLSRRGHE